MNKICVIIPCYNEEQTIVKVIQDFKKELPEAEIVVVDNNSKDKTSALAKEAGATVLLERRQGKGNAMRKAFNEVDADVCVMVDGDDTYPANEAYKLINLVLEDGVDMAIGTRLENFTKEKKKILHGLGNKFFVNLVNFIFRSNFKDIFSGYRAFSRDFIKTLPLLSEGFEIESELTIKSLQRGYRVKEIPTAYQDRPDGSESKLSTFRDGWKILMAIFSILRDYRPMAFFSFLAFIFIIAGGATGTIVILDYLEKGIVTRVPFAIVTSMLVISGLICFIGGFIVSAINRRFEELAELQKKK